MAEVIIPTLGESISTGILAAWHVQDGDQVEAGQLIYELETDKITQEGTAEVGGKISLKAAEGDEVAIGAVVAVIDESAAGAAPAAAAPAAEPAEAPAAPAAEAAPTAPAEAPAKSDAPAAPLSPAARKAAAETGVDPATVQGTGKDGRVTKADILAASEAPAKAAPTPAPAAKAAPAPATTAAPAALSGEERRTRKKMTPLRKRIAERLVMAQHHAAILTTFNEVDMSGIMAVRKKYQDHFVEKHGCKLGFMSFFVKAAVNALQQVPSINAQIEGDEIVQNHFYDVGVAVGTPKGLVVPVVRDCESKSFAQIEQDIIGYAKKARDGRIEIKDLEGGCFTISNGGIYGSMLSTPILNPPQSGILGMHNIVKRAVVVNDEIVIRPMMYLALSYDHRIVDGQEAVTFLIKIKQAIEEPTRLLFDI